MIRGKVDITWNAYADRLSILLVADVGAGLRYLMLVEEGLLLVSENCLRVTAKMCYGLTHMAHCFDGKE